jgi:hypothetical protein
MKECMKNEKKKNGRKSKKEIKNICRKKLGFKEK